MLQLSLKANKNSSVDKFPNPQSLKKTINSCTKKSNSNSVGGLFIPVIAQTLYIKSVK